MNLPFPKRRYKIKNQRTIPKFSVFIDICKLVFLSKKVILGLLLRPPSWNSKTSL